MSVVFDPVRVRDYLRSRLPERRDLAVERIERIVGGMSRQTHFVVASWTEGTSRKSQVFNFRADHERLRHLTVPLWWEFRVLERLHGTDIPVAQPYWYEEDPGILGVAPFYVRQVVPGSAKSKPLFAPGSEERRRSLGRQMVRHLAKLHTLDWRSLGFGSFMPVPEGPADAYDVELDRWERFYKANELEPRPMIAEIFGRLRREQPPPPDRVSLIWGDVGIGQFIYEGDRITALTDFEMSRLGDPMLDWSAAINRGLDDLLPRNEAYALYEAESGIAIDEQRIAYGTMVSATACFCWHPLLADLTGKPPLDAALMRLGAGLSWQWMHTANRLLREWRPDARHGLR